MLRIAYYALTNNFKFQFYTNQMKQKTNNNNNHNALYNKCNAWPQSASDISIQLSSKQRKMFHRNGIELASPSVSSHSGIIGNTRNNRNTLNGGVGGGPLTDLSSGTSLSSLSSLSGSSAAKSPRLHTPRNPVLGIGCNDADSYRGRRRTERGS